MATHQLIRRTCLAALGLLACLAVGPGRAVRGDDPDKPSATAWTYEEAVRQLRLHPRDPYLQYVVLQLGKRENNAEGAYTEIESASRPGRFEVQGRRANVDLFSTFTGAL